MSHPRIWCAPAVCTPIDTLWCMNLSCHVWMSHVIPEWVMSRMNESHHMYVWVKSQSRIHGRHTRSLSLSLSPSPSLSLYLSLRVLLFTCVTYGGHTQTLFLSLFLFFSHCVYSYSHVWHMHESCHIHKWVMSHKRMNHANESYRTWHTCELDV